MAVKSSGRGGVVGSGGGTQYQQLASGVHLQVEGIVLAKGTATRAVAPQVRGVEQSAAIGRELGNAHVSIEKSGFDSA